MQAATPDPDSAGRRVHDQAATTSAGDATADAQRAVLPADMSRFLVDFSIALHRIAMYPRDHPSLLPALDALVQRTQALLDDRPLFAMGVARDRLVIEGVVSEVNHPLLRSLAEHLHRHYLGAISFQRGVSGSELIELVAALAEDPSRGRGAVGRLPKAEAPCWPHVALHPLTIDGLEIIEDGNADRTSASGRHADLWVGLARAALERGGGEDSDPFDGEPAAVAHAINEHQRVEAYDQVIVGYLSQIADELRGGAADAVDLRRRVSALVSSIDPDTLRRLLEMGGDAVGRHQFLQNASFGMAAGAVVTLVKSAAEASDQTVSTGLVRLLTKLAAHAEAGSSKVRSLADSALRSQVDRLINGWSLPNPTPSDYTEVLDRVAREGGVDAQHTSSCSIAVEPLRIAKMCLELDEEAPALWRAIDRVAEEGNLSCLIDALEQASIEDDLPGRVWTHVTSREMVRRLLCVVPPDLTTVDRLLPRLHGDALSPLFQLLTESDDRTMRRAAFDRLRRLGPRGAAEIVPRLSDERWYSQRNLLALLAEMEDLPNEYNPLPHLAHEDPRVRREALRVALRLPAVRDQALSAGLADADPRVLRIALTAVPERCPASLARQVMALVAQDSLDDDVRAVAVEALGRGVRGSQALVALLSVASRARRFWRGPILAPKSASMIAALTALAANWASEPRAAAVIRRATASPDADIRRAVSGASR